MAEMLIQSENLVAIADKIRVLSGTTEGMGLEDMASTINTENINFESNLNTQDNLISQIQTALQNKASASEPVLQTKTVTPTTSSQDVTPDNGYDGLSKVTVNAMPTATQATPSISVNSSGLITASATQTAGYVAAGTKSGTKQLTTQSAKTITPSTSSQTAVSSGVYTTGTVTVGAIPSTYVKPNSTKTATTYTPTTSNQTITAGTYCSGTQTIKGDSNLVASNIKSGVSIFGVSGSYEGSGGSGGEGVETATVDVIATGVTTLYYVGASGLCSISGIRNTVEMIVPSICYAELLTSNSYFLATNTQGDCTLISSMNISSNSTAFSVTGAGSIIVPSQQKEM